MVAMRKHSSKLGYLVAAIVLSLWAGYLFTAIPPVQAEPNGGPLADLQRQVRNLQVSQNVQDAFLDELDDRVTDLEAVVFCCGGGGGGGGGGGTGGDADQDRDGYSPNQGDCDDFDARTHPGAVEVLDGKDNDCNGVVDDIR